MAEKAELEKLNKGPLVDYTMQVLTQYEQLVENYNNLANQSIELQKQNEDLNTKLASASQPEVAPMEVGQVMEHPEYIIMFKKADSLEAKVEALAKDYTQLEVTLKETKSELDEALVLIENLKIENAKVKSNKTIENINTLPKSKSDTMYSVNNYTIKGYENRVDNSKTYGGKEFNIAYVTTKVENNMLSWKIDFVGSDLFPPTVINRYQIFNEHDLGALSRSVSKLGWFGAIKSYLSIPDTFQPDNFYNCGLFYGTVHSGAVE